MTAAAVLGRDARQGSGTVGAALAAAAARLREAGIDEPRREARLLVAAALGSDVAAVLGYPERLIACDAAVRLEALVERRAAREPAARLVGHREFWGLDFLLSPATLVPRPDSETLVEAALTVRSDRGAPLRILDLGTGTGCLLLTLLHEFPEATGIGVDLAAEAVAMARHNAVRLGMAARACFVVSDWGEALAASFDLVISNPPYIESAAIPLLAAEVARYDPALALDGGADGLAAYRRLAIAAARLIGPGGHAFVELGAGQAAAVARIMRGAGLEVALVRHDLSGIERCIALGRIAARNFAENQ